jgi:hypothetical protein
VRKRRNRLNFLTRTTTEATAGTRARSLTGKRAASPIPCTEILFTEEAITVRVIIEVFGRALMFQFVQGKVEASESPGEFEDAPPSDPHGTSSAHIERGAGADAFTSDVVARKFGFNSELSLRYPEPSVSAELPKALPHGS